jgi:DNA polymerase-3 subunit delta
MSLRKQIAAGKIAAVYLLWGEDAAAINAVIKELRQAFFAADKAGAGLEAFNHERFDAPYVKSVGEVLTACAQMPMVAPRRLVELAGVDDMHKQVQAETTKEQAHAALIDYLEAPNPACTLVISSPKLKGTSKLAKAAKAAAKARSGEVVEAKFGALREDDAVSALEFEARERGVQLGRGVAAALVASVGTVRAELISALERAVAHAAGKRVGVEDVQAVVVGTREADIFALTDAIGRRDQTRALALLATMFRHGEKDTGQAMRVFSMLVWQLRRLCIAKFADDPEQALGIKPFAVRKLREQSQAFSDDELQRAYASLAALDAQFKGGSKVAYLSPYLVLQRWILGACGGLPGVAQANG